MHRTPATRRLLPAALALLAAACGDSGAPPQPVSLDAAAFAGSLDALDAVLASEPWVSFGALGPAFVLPAPTGPARVARVPVIPDPSLGSTFVHDGAGYVADPARSDAPSDGVRFVLYALQPGTDAPILTEEIATADVRDVGRELTNGFALDVAVTTLAGDVARYSASFEAGGAPPAGGGATVRDHDGVLLAGAVAGPDDGLAFEIVSGVVDGVTVSDVATALEIGDLEIVGVLGEDAAAGRLDFDVSLSTGGATVRVTGARADGVLQATISISGTTIATASGAGSPVVTASRGYDLSPSQTAALARVTGAVETILALTHHVVEPVELQ